MGPPSLDQAVDTSACVGLLPPESCVVACAVGYAGSSVTYHCYSADDGFFGAGPVCTPATTVTSTLWWGANDTSTSAAANSTSTLWWDANITSTSSLTTDTTTTVGSEPPTSGAKVAAAAPMVGVLIAIIAIV